jgi:hypothetical protein
MHSDSDHHTERRVRAPSAKQLDPSCGAGPRAPEAVDQPEQLQVCVQCGSWLVYPLAWSEAGPQRWRLQLRCPECESIRAGVFEQAVVERLDDELDRAANALLEDMRRVTHANMSEEVEFFVRALAADLIDAGDF